VWQRSAAALRLWLKRYYRAMPKPSSRVAGLPKADSMYRTYVSQCRRLGVKPVSLVRAKALIREWTATLAAGRTEPPPR
jgi:hypothetical protein